MLRRAVAEASANLNPQDVVPLRFDRLIEVMTQLAAEKIDVGLPEVRIKELAELAAYESVGLSRVLALAKDGRVTEFFVDSGESPVYLDHTEAGRCETTISLTAR
jgi:Flp pilus assembly CpaF family ATPase